MGWQKINSLIKAYSDDLSSYYQDCEGYLVGTGHEEGYYCFKQGPWSDRKPFISNTFYPHFVINIGGNKQTLFIKDFTFNGHRVFNNTNNYAFWSNGENKWVYPVNSSNAGAGTGLHEPYYYTDIDDTLQGDYFYKGNFPATVNPVEPTAWTLSGAIPEYTSYPSEAGVTLEQNVWAWHDNGDRGAVLSGFCGKYYNEKDGSWKMVGVPAFGAETAVAGAYAFGETFIRGPKDENEKYVYEGDKGHTIRYHGGQWMMGRYGTGTWSEGSEPSLHAGEEVEFKGYELDQGTGQVVPDPKGDFKVVFKHCEMGSEMSHVLMGEVSLWRRSTTD